MLTGLLFFLQVAEWPTKFFELFRIKRVSRLVCERSSCGQTVSVTWRHVKMQTNWSRFTAMSTFLRHCSQGVEFTQTLSAIWVEFLGRCLLLESANSTPTLPPLSYCRSFSWSSRNGMHAARKFISSHSAAVKVGFLVTWRKWPAPVLLKQMPLDENNLQLPVWDPRVSHFTLTLSMVSLAT